VTRRVPALAACGGLGLAVGVVGTTTHRAAVPWGLVAALLAAACAGVLCRALASGAGLAVYAGGLLLATQLLSQVRPGGDILVASDGLGHAWLFGSVLTCAVVAFLPARWFDPSR
jgi:hypothetical protein